MADGQDSAQSAHGSQVEREMKINLRPYDWPRWEFEGSRAQIEAEGVIPAGTQWPVGCADINWVAGPLQFQLRRTRPDWLKGPMRLWVNGDWWILVCTPVNQPDPFQQRVTDARAALAREIYEQSPEGRRAWNENYSRWEATKRDGDFLKFKRLIPALNPPRRGRTAKAQH